MAGKGSADYNENPELKCNPEFRRLCLPLQQNDVNKLEAHIKSAHKPIEIKTWNHTILYEYELYEMCVKMNVRIRMVRIFATSYEEALLYVCLKQLERTDLPTAMRRYLIGKRYLYEKVLGAHEAAVIRSSKKIKELRQDSEPRYYHNATRTSERIGKEYRLKGNTVAKYSWYAEALDKIYNISDTFTTMIMLEEIKISQEKIIELSKLPNKEIFAIASSLMNNTKDYPTFSHFRRFIKKMETEIVVDTARHSIKDIPEYDPDAEISSLALTIPSWISTIDRVQKTADMEKASTNAKIQLEKELNSLEFKILEIFDKVKE